MTPMGFSRHPDVTIQILAILHKCGASSATALSLEDRQTAYKIVWCNNLADTLDWKVENGLR